MAVRFGQTFEKDAKVTFDLDFSDNPEIMVVKESRFHYTRVETFDGVSISYRTTDLSYAQIPAAI